MIARSLARWRLVMLAAYALATPAALVAQSGAPTPPTPQHHAADSHVSEADLRAHIAYLADDALEGRYPGTPGETLTAAYIAGQLAAQGFVGAMPDGSFYQPVALVSLTTSDSHARFTRTNGDAMIVGDVMLRAPLGPVDLRNVPLVWVGYGTDRDGMVIMDVRGKVALLLQANRDGEPTLNLEARRNALIAAGAIGTLVVPSANADTASLRRNFNRRRLALASRFGRGQIDGILSSDAANILLAAASLNSSRARAAADDNDYAGADIPVTANLFANSVRQQLNSYNVVARLPGRVADSGAVLLMGHWDHLGLCRPEGAQDRICNGAVDNASGIAVLLEVAARLGAAAQAGHSLDRDVMIVATTAEEQGLLGAYHFTENPLVPLTSIAVTLNIDTVAIAARGAPMAVVGRVDYPLLAREFERVARALGRPVDSDQAAESFVRRQDGWALSQSGVPALMAGGSFSDMGKVEAYTAGDYHSPADELRDTTPLGGAADDADLHLALTRHFASLHSWPDLRGPDN